MKIIFSFILIFSSLFSIAQPITPTFKQAAPIWANLLINPYNIDEPKKNDKGQYSYFLSNKSIIRDSFQYSFRMTTTDSFGIDGYISKDQLSHRSDRMARPYKCSQPKCRSFSPTFQYQF